MPKEREHTILRLVPYLFSRGLEDLVLLFVNVKLKQRRRIWQMGWWNYEGGG